MTKIGSVVALSCFLLLCQQMRQIDSFATSLMPGQGKRNLASGNVYDAENELSKLWGKDVDYNRLARVPFAALLSGEHHQWPRFGRSVTKKKRL
ncbi:hypothetical protein ABFA07_011896 [Porites harrisoni]